MAESRKVLSILIVLGFCLSGLSVLVFEPQLARASVAPSIFNPITSLTGSVVLTGYSYQKPITITNSGSSLTDYQMLFEVDTASLISAEKMLSDCGDLRFATSTGTELSYWIESGINTSATNVWVKISSIPAGTSTIYMCYGNSGATSASNVDATFMLFDNFNAETIDTSKWVQSTVVSGTIDPSGTTVKMGQTSSGGHAKLRSKNSFAFPVWLEAYVTQNNNIGSIGISTSTSVGNQGWFYSGYSTRWYTIGDADMYLDKVDGSGNVTSLHYSTSPPVVPAIWKIRWSSGSQYATDGVIEKTGTDSTISEGNVYVNLGCGDGWWGADTWTIYDWVRVRKYASSEPTYLIGAEEELNQAPTASFTYPPSSPTTETAIQFTDTSTDSDGTIASWSWNFGDGGTSTLQNPTHQYSSAGTYTVTLTVTDNGGTTGSASQSITASALAPSSTTLSVSPSSFTLSSGGSTTLTATLKDNNNNVLANKTISWSATTGSLSASSGTTNSSGQVSVTYTAPTVTAQTSVTITASFSGDDSYQSSSRTLTGTVYELVLPSTSLSVSPSSFTVSSGGSTTLTATLMSDGSPVVGKTITWSTTTGTLSPSSGTTNSSGQVSVTYTAPTVTTQTSASITVSFAGDDSYQSSSVGSSATITAPLSTILSTSPSTFTLEGGGSIIMTATLTDISGNVLTDKAITWSATAGFLSATSGATVTYTAPTVTTQTAVTVTASFAGDATYSGSQASLVGTITTTPQASTSIVISPLVFDAKSGENVVLTILLTEGGVPVAGKTVTLSTTAGSIAPSSGITDSAGTITATFTAPSVDIRTSFITAASFAGDNEYSPTAAYSTGTVLPPELAETIERLENTMTKLEVSMEDLASKIESLTDAIAENRIALGIIIEEGQSEMEYEHPEIDAEVEIKGTNIEVRVDSLVESGKTALVNIDDYTKKALQLDHIAVWVDGQEIGQANDYDDVLDPTNDGDDAEYLILVGGNGIQVLVSIPHFSTRTITIGTLPTQPFAGEIPVWVIVASALALVIAMTAVIWHHLRESRGETTSMLIEKGLPKLRIEEVEVVREMRSMGEFTIPDLMQRTGSSKILAWRTVQKLMKKGLVEPTEEVKPPATGRGKPSMVFKYVGD